MFDADIPSIHVSDEIVRHMMYGLISRMFSHPDGQIFRIHLKNMYSGMQKRLKTEIVPIKSLFLQMPGQDMALPGHPSFLKH